MGLVLQVAQHMLLACCSAFGAGSLSSAYVGHWAPAPASPPSETNTSVHLRFVVSTTVCVPSVTGVYNVNVQDIARMSFARVVWRTSCSQATNGAGLAPWSMLRFKKAIDLVANCQHILPEPRQACGEIPQMKGNQKQTVLLPKDAICKRRWPTQLA